MQAVKITRGKIYANSEDHSKLIYASHENLSLRLPHCQLPSSSTKRTNKSSKDCTWSAECNALLGVISKRSGVRAGQWPLRANVGHRGEFSDMILALWEQIKDF